MEIGADCGIVSAPTFAEKLGITPYESLLLQKAARLGLHSASSMERLAVMRGCWHYGSRDQFPVSNISESEFSNEELAVALLSPSLPYSPHSIRVGAAMLGASGNRLDLLAELVTAEGCVGPVRYIARAGTRFEPENPFWTQMLDRLPEAPSIAEGIMPHPTRFVSMTGMTRAGVGTITVWIRPRPDLALVNG